MLTTILDVCNSLAVPNFKKKKKKKKMMLKYFTASNPKVSASLDFHPSIHYLDTLLPLGSWGVTGARYHLT